MLKTISSLALLPDNGMTIGERLSSAGIMLLQGMITVFLVLFIIMLSLLVMEFFFKRKDRKNKEASQTAVDVPMTGDTVSSSEEASEGELIAVITASVAAFRAENKESSGGFRVVSFKKTGGNTNWNKK